LETATISLVAKDTYRLAFSRGRLNSGDRTEYGFGWLLYRYQNERLISHNGSWIGFKTYIGRYPARKLTVVN
jgi:beta-lactamase family protein